MTETAKDLELIHYGVKGMKWGVRRKDVPSGPRKFEDLSKKEARKAEKILRKNSISVHNKVADYMNDVALPKLNKKYSGNLLDDSGEYNKTGKKYLEEHDKIFNEKMREISFETIREKTKGRIDLNG